MKKELTGCGRGADSQGDGRALVPKSITASSLTGAEGKGGQGHREMSVEEGAEELHAVWLGPGFRWTEGQGPF